MKNPYGATSSESVGTSDTPAVMARAQALIKEMEETPLGWESLYPDFWIQGYNNKGESTSACSIAHVTLAWMLPYSMYVYLICMNVHAWDSVCAPTCA